MSKNASAETKQHVVDLVQYLKQEKLRLTSAVREFLNVNNGAYSMEILNDIPDDAVQNCNYTSKAKKVWK